MERTRRHRRHRRALDAAWVLAVAGVIAAGAAPRPARADIEIPGDAKNVIDVDTPRTANSNTPVHDFDLTIKIGLVAPIPTQVGLLITDAQRHKVGNATDMPQAGNNPNGPTPTLNADATTATYRWDLKGVQLSNVHWQVGFIFHSMINADPATALHWTDLNGNVLADPIPLTAWHVDGKNINGNDPLAFTISNPTGTDERITGLSFLSPTSGKTLDELANGLSGPGLVTVPDFSLAAGASTDFLFDGTGGLPRLDPGAILDAVWTASFPSLPDSQSVTQTIEHTPEPASLALLGLGAAGLLARRIATGRRA